MIFFFSYSSLQRLKQDIESLLLRLSQTLALHEQPIFLINNYDLITSVLSELTTPCVDVENEYFSHQLTKQIELFVEAELKVSHVT